MVNGSLDNDQVNKCPLCDNKGDYDTVLYTEGYRRGYAENLCLEHCSSRNKEDKHSIVKREHPHGHWRVACMVQHTRMPAYCVPYLRERTKIKIVHTTGRRGGHVPQISPSCSGNPPVWWFHSCWSPGPSLPSPFLPECCGPADNMMLWVGSAWVKEASHLTRLNKCKKKTVRCHLLNSKVRQQWFRQESKSHFWTQAVSFSRTKDTKSVINKLMEDVWAIPTLSTWKIKSSSQTFSKHLSKVSTNTYNVKNGM